jgi:thiamine pyrophosphokinase
MRGVLIVGNGDSPSGSVLDFFVSKSSTIIALDGAAVTLQKRQITPDVIIGDMDGLTSEQLDVFHSQGIEIICDSTQDTSDISKGLSWSKEHHPGRQIDVVGISGGRLDHQLAAFSALFECQSDARLHIDDWMAVRVTKIPIRYSTAKGKNISLIPFGEVSGVILSGCKYPLSNENLSSGTKGIHNEALGQEITISCQQGDLLLLIND